MMAKNNDRRMLVYLFLLIAAGLLAFTIFMKVPEQGTNSVLLVVDYDAAGNVIQSKEVTVTKKNFPTLQAITGDPEVDSLMGDNVIEVSLPNVPAGAVTRTVTMSVQNTGNQGIYYVVQVAKIVGTYWI